MLNLLGRFISLLSNYNTYLSYYFTGPKEFFYKGHNYFFTGHLVELKDKKFDWLDGRNLCREYCMDLTTLETQEENNLIFKLIQQSIFFTQFLFQELKKKIANVS